MTLDSEWLRCGGEISGRENPGLDRGHVAVDRMLAQTGAAASDLNETEDVPAGFPDGSPDLRFEQTEKLSVVTLS